ncbi:hypothetical protein Y032_0020g20 [Ancylostoma ceylanicum]|uniref:Uncharacterized protein n=1 Tax=Ancylostoma ceylanicum TaxID=53326 RepID=A0A016V2X8_9BILA|nr:hypothetical protein Y032_0020g20 [Ancylostoma ceylanicum]
MPLVRGIGSVGCLLARCVCVRGEKQQLLLDRPIDNTAASITPTKHDAPEQTTATTRLDFAAGPVRSSRVSLEDELAHSETFEWQIDPRKIAALVENPSPSAAAICICGSDGKD